VSPTLLKIPGVYFFRPPSQVIAEIDREILILFCVKYPKVIGAVLYDPAGTQDIADLLDRCLNQFFALEIERSSIQVKICGLSHPYVATIARANKWLRNNRLRVVGADIGRFVKRSIVVDTEKGLLGVRARFIAPPQPMFLTGSPRQRRRAP